jgi:hypothetical protein
VRQATDPIFGRLDRIAAKWKPRADTLDGTGMVGPSVLRNFCHLSFRCAIQSSQIQLLTMGGQWRARILCPTKARLLPVRQYIGALVWKCSCGTRNSHGNVRQTLNIPRRNRREPNPQQVYNSKSAHAMHRPASRGEGIFRCSNR